MDNRNLEDSTYKVFRSDDDFARMVIRIAAATPVDAILCATETGGLASRVHGLSQEARVIAATTNAQTYDALIKKGLETIMLPIRAIDRHLAAAAVTKRTAATAIVVSATDGNVRAFSGGAMVLQLDPNVLYDLRVEDR